MKQIIVLATTFLSVLNMSGQAPDINWQRSYGGSGHDWGYAIQPTSDGGFIAAGNTTSNDNDVTENFGNQDYWIIKLSSNGNIQWQKSYGGTGHEQPDIIYQTPDGGYITGGMRNDVDDEGGYYYWLIKLDAVGNMEWEKSFPKLYSHEGSTSLQLLPDGSYVIGASTFYDGETELTHSDFALVKLDVNGATEWEKSYGGSGMENAECVQLTSDGGYVMTGDSASSDGDATEHKGGGDYWVVKLDEAGDIQWQKSMGGTITDLARYVSETPDGGYIVTGFVMSADGDVTGHHGNYDVWTVKLDNEGIMQWEKSSGGSGDDRGYSVHNASDGGYIIGGNSSESNGDVSNNYGWGDVWLLKLDDDGNMVWEKSYGGNSTDLLFSGKPLSDGGYIMAGISNSANADLTNNYGLEDIWIAKIGGEVASTLEFIKDSVIVFPNPARDLLHFSELLHKVEVYGIDGKKLLAATEKERLNVSSLPAGIYILKTETFGQIQNIKFIKE